MKKVLKYIAVCFSLFFVFFLSTACGNDLVGIRLTCPDLKELGKSYYAANVGREFTVSVETAPADFNLTDKLKWESNNTGIATVDNNGKVTPVSAGKATITAKYKQNEKVTASITIKVFTQSDEDLSFTRELYSGYYGDEISIDIVQEYENVIFEFTGTLANGTEYPAEQKNVQPKQAGIYKVSTTYESFSAEAALIIEQRALTIPVENYKKTYGANAVTKESGVITDDFGNTNNEYDNTLPNGDVDKIYYSLKCEAVDVATPENTTYKPVGVYPVTIVVDETKTSNFANNYVISENNSTTGTLTIEPLAVTLVAKDKTDIYGSNNSFQTTSNYSLYRTAEYEITPDDKLNEIPDLASANFNGVFTSQISFSTTIYKDGTPYKGKMNVGTYDLVCSTTQILGQNVNGKTVKNLTITSSDIVDAEYTITPRPLTIYPVEKQSKFAGTPDPVFDYTTNSGGIVDGDEDLLLPFLTRVSTESNVPGRYDYSIITYGDAENFVVNDNYTITLSSENNQFEIKPNTVYFVLKGQVLDYGQEVEEFEYDVFYNGTKIENLDISNDGWITLQSYTYEQDNPEKTFVNKIKPTILKSETPADDSGTYYKKYPIVLDYVFDENNEGYNSEDKKDSFFDVDYNQTSPGYVCFNKIDLIVKPYATGNALTKIYDNNNYTDASITEATCEGFIEGETSYTDVFSAIEFQKQDTSTLVGKYPLELIYHSFKEGKDFYNVIQSDEIVYYEITPREIEISLSENQTKVYGSETKEISYNVDNLATGDLVKDVIYSISISKGVGEDVGSYSYNLDSITLNANYTHKFNKYLTDGVTENKFTITPRTLNIIAVSQSVVYGENINTLTYVVSIDNPEGETLLAQYKPLIIGSPETLAKKYSVVGDYDITVGTLDAGSNFNIVFTKGKVSVLKRSATFTVLASEVSTGTTPNASDIQYSFEGLVEGTVPEISLNILPDNETTPTKYALSGEVYGKNNAASSLSFNYDNGTDVFNSLRLVFNGENVFSCYDITINSTVAFYVASLVINLSIVDYENLTSSIVTTTYDGGKKDSLFTIVCDDNSYSIAPVNEETGYNFIYKKPGIETALAEAPTDAGTYNVSINTASIKVTKVNTGEDVIPTLNISAYGSLVINKANLYYKTDENKPAIRPMEFGSTTLPTELVGKKISDTPLEYAPVEIYSDAACTNQVAFGVKATYNTEVYSENYIKSLTVQGSPYTVSMMIVPSLEADQANYNSVAINFDLVITPKNMNVSGASFAYSQGVRSATYTNKVINNPLTLSIDESFADKIGVSYAYVGVNYDSTNPEAYGMLAYYEEEIYVGDYSNIKYILRTDLSGANFSFDPVKNYILASKGSNDYYLPLTHLSGVPINAGIYFVVANIRATNGNYALSSDAVTQYSTLFEITRSEEFEINNWIEEFMFGISATEIVDKFSFTTNPSRVKAYCSIVYELGDDILYLEGTDIIAICPADQTYKVKVIISSPNYFQEKDMTFKIIQLDAVISFPAADKYHYTGSEVYSFILNTKVTLYNLDGSTEILVHDNFSEIGPYGEAPMQVTYYHATDEDGDGTPDTKGEALEGGPIEVGYYYMDCIYNDRTYYGTNGAYFEITKTYYSGAISLENASFTYDPFLSLERSDITGKDGLYTWIRDNMIKIPVSEANLVHYKKTKGAIGNPNKQIHLAVVMQNGEDLVIGGAEGIKNCGTYTIRLILTFTDGITQTTTSEATLTINKVALSTDAFETGNGATFVYSGHDKYNELKYLGATSTAMSVPVVGYKQFPLPSGDIEGWYGYFNRDASNFCIVYNYLKKNPTSGVYEAIDPNVMNRAPITPGEYSCSYKIIAGDNYLVQNTVIPDAYFTIRTTDFNTSDSSPLTVVYDGSDQSINPDLKLTITNDDPSEIKITCVYEYEGNYYDYNGGDVSIVEGEYDETKGLIFEKYFYKYTTWDTIETGRVLDTENKLTKESIKDAGHYRVYYKLIYPTLSNFEKFFSFPVDKYNIFADPAHEDNLLDSLVTITEAPFRTISNNLESNELGVVFYDASNVVQRYLNNPVMAELVVDPDEGEIEKSLSSIDNPLLTITQGVIKIYINGSEKDNLSLSVYDADDSSLIGFTREEGTNVYVSNGNVPVGNYYFVLSHSKEGVQNYYESVYCYFKVVKAKAELKIKTSNMTQDATTGNYLLKDTDILFNFEQEPSKVIMEYNKTYSFEDNTIMNKWLQAGSIPGPVFSIEYYTEEGCLNKKTGSITTFDVGTYWAKIDIDNTEYSVKDPLVLQIDITPTLDYTITVTKATFVYQNYTTTSFAVSAKYSTSTIYGKQIFFIDDENLTDEYKTLMGQFITDNSGQGYELRTQNSVIDSVAGAYNTVGFFIPTSENYLPKAFGYKYIVTSQSISIEDISSIELTNIFTVDTAWDGSAWNFTALSILGSTSYPATITLTNGTILDTYVKFSTEVNVASNYLAQYFSNPSQTTLPWSSFASNQQLDFESGDYTFSQYLSIINDKLIVSLAKPSLQTVIRQIGGINKTYNGIASTLDAKSLAYSFVTIMNGENPYDPQPLQGFDDIVQKIYNNDSNILTIASDDLAIGSGTNYVYPISTIEVGNYKFGVTFKESTCFAETTYEVSYNINKISASAISRIRYEHEGRYIENVGDIIIDPFGNMEGANGTGMFYLYDSGTASYICLGTSLDNTKFQFQIDGNWYSPTEEYLATMSYHVGPSSMGSIGEDSLGLANLIAQDYSSTIYVKIKFTFDESSVISGVCFMEFVKATMYSVE